MSRKDPAQRRGRPDAKAERARSAQGPVISPAGAKFLGVRPRDWASGAFLLLVTLAMFSKGLTDPASIIHEDAAYQFQPFYQFVADEVKAGRFPHWCPYVSCGVPFHSTLHGAVLYPLRLPLIWMDYCTAYVASLIVHYFLTALFTYVFIRVTLRCGALASLVGAISFAFGGFTFGHVTHWNYFQAYPWFILAVFFFSRAVEKSSWLWAVWAAIPVALIGLVGAVHLLLILGLGLGIWGAAETILRGIRRLRSRQGTAAEVFLPIGATGIACALGGLIALAQLWPAQLQSELSTRGGGMSFAEITEMSAHPVRTVQRMVVPFLYGNYRLGYWEGGRHHYGYWADGNYHETTFYAGIVPLAAAVLAIGICRRNRWVPRLAVFGLLMFILAAGRFLPVFELLYKLVPGFDRLRNPARIFWWVQLCIACLAAIGIDRGLALGAKELSRRARIASAAVGGIVLVGLAGGLLAIAALRGGDSWGRDFVLRNDWLYKADTATMTKRMAGVAREVIDDSDFLTWAGVAAGAASAIAAAAFFGLGRIRGRSSAAVLAVLVAADLGLASTGMLHYSTNLNVLTHTPPQMRFLQEHAGAQRYVALQGVNDDEAGRNRAMQFRVPNAATPDPGIFHTPRQRMLVGLTYGSRRVLDLVGAKYLVNDLQSPLLPDLPVASREGAVIYRNDQAFPLAFLARRVVVERNLNAVIQMLARGPADLRDVAILEADPSGTPLPPTDQPPGDVLDFQPAAAEYRMKTRADGPRQLVLTVTYHPEWKCAVDGQETPIGETDLGFMSVRVPGGEHQVRWWYDPARFHQGLVGTVIGLISAIGVLIVVPLLGRRRTSQTSVPKAGQ